MRDFLSTRRAKITPDMAGLPTGSDVRRVPGLRREEVAILSGVSVDYYTRIEKGDLTGVSDEVLDAVARALHMTDDETAYLYDLARAVRRPARARKRAKPSSTVPRQAQLLIDSMNTTPVIAHNGCLDILAANPLGRALFSVVYDSPTRRSAAAPPNLASFVFLDPAAGEFYADLDDTAATVVRMLRAQAATTPHESRLTALVGELLHAKRGLPYPLGRPRRRQASRRQQGPPSSRGRRPRPRVRGTHPRLQPVDRTVRLHRRTRLSHSGTAPTAGSPGSDDDPYTTLTLAE